MDSHDWGFLGSFSEKQPALRKEGKCVKVVRWTCANARFSLSDTQTVVLLPNIEGGSKLNLKSIFGELLSILTTTHWMAREGLYNISVQNTKVCYFENLELLVLLQKGTKMLVWMKQVQNAESLKSPLQENHMGWEGIGPYSESENIAPDWVFMFS